MKFRDPKTGEVFEDIDTAIWNKCRRRDPCDTNCPLFKLRKHIACRDYVISHPAEVARLMGLEVVEEPAMGETQGGKSLFCEHIGVAPSQPFIVHGYPYRNYPPMVYGEDGCVRLYAPDGQKRHKVGGRTITWIVDHPECVEPCEGYTPQEVAFKKEEPMEKKDKPRICEVLGGKDNPLEVDEVWCITGNDRAQYRITYDGNLEYRMPNYNGTGYGRWISTDVPTDFIAHPDRIIRKPRFTQEEVERAKAILMLYPKAETMEVVCPYIRIFGGGFLLTHVDAELFPSLRPGQAVRLEDIT